jgi:hypothetical protein
MQLPAPRAPRLVRIFAKSAVLDSWFSCKEGVPFHAVCLIPWVRRDIVRCIDSCTGEWHFPGLRHCPRETHELAGPEFWACGGASATKARFTKQGRDQFQCRAARAVSVYNVPELTTKARVGSNGDIYLPQIDYVHVADLAPEEAQTLIEKRFSDGGFVKNPHVTIFIDEYASQTVTVLGQVAKPEPYPLLGDRRLYDVISAAGDSLTEQKKR